MPGESLTWFDPPSPATEEEIAAAESIIGYRFPDDYREFAKRYGGASPNETDFEFRDHDTRTFFASLATFFTFGPEDDGSIFRKMKAEFFPSGLIPFAGDGGGNYICFDFRDNRPEVPVVFWNHGERGLKGEVSLVSDSFTSLLSMLRLPDDADLD